jgi:lipoyl(octanoyl) transferase
MGSLKDNLTICHLGRRPFNETWQAMRDYTINRNENSKDALWVVEHESIFTLGQAGKESHILAPHNIPITKTDRGGQVTYHGPGQIIIYILTDLRRLQIGIRTLVSRLETALIHYLKDNQIEAFANPSAPGVYIGEAKIASIGLKVSKGCTYHGIAFNAQMDLTPFSYINPCGFKNLKMTQLSDFKTNIDFTKLTNELLFYIQSSLYQIAPNS